MSCKPSITIKGGKGVILHYVEKIFKSFCANYWPYLKESVKDIRAAAVWITLLTLGSSLTPGVLLGFVMWGMIQIYEYGCKLQSQAAETL